MRIKFLFYLEFLNLLRRFASEFTNKVCFMQEKNGELTVMGLRAYYQKLSQKEKVRLKNFVAQKFELSYFTIDSKFSGRGNFSAAELLAMQPIITAETWRQ